MNSMDKMAQAILDSIQKATDNQCIGFKWEIGYAPKVRNSHACPVNGVTNCMGLPEHPSGYRGFEGRVWLRLNLDLKKRHVNWGSDAFIGSRSHTGTGGAGSYNGPWKYTDRIPCYSWDYRIFIDDWPDLGIDDLLRDHEYQNERRRLLSILKNGHDYHHRDHRLGHSFFWDATAEENLEKVVDIDLAS